MEKASFPARLLLMRHGEAEGSPDRERVLTKTGMAQCRAVAMALQQNNIQPDFILCSGLRRTRETLLALGFKNISTHFCDDDLYHANNTADILRIIGEHVPAAARALLVIGHNPTIHMAACDLAGAGTKQETAKIAAHYPPATISIFSVEWDNWASPRRAENILEQVIQPDF